MKEGGPEMGAAGADPAASEGLGRLFESARSDGLAAPELDELWSRIGPGALLGSADPSAGAGTTAGAPGGGALGALGGATAKVIAVVVVVGGGLVAGGLALRGTFARSATSTASHPVIVVPAAPQRLAPSVGVAPPASPDPSPGAVDVSALPLAPSPPNAGNAGVVGHAGPRSRPSGEPDVRPGDPELARQFPAQGAPSNRGTAGANASPSALGGADTAAQPAAYGGSPQAGRMAAASSSSPSEGALLLRARQQIRSDPAGALALTDEHARRFPAGTLAPEREVLAIEALAALGRTSEARARLGAFRDRYPQSPHLPRLEALVAR